MDSIEDEDKFKNKHFASLNFHYLLPLMIQIRIRNTA